MEKRESEFSTPMTPPPGDKDPERQSRALAMGAIRVLPKPFEPTDLLHALGGPAAPARPAGVP